MEVSLYFCTSLYYNFPPPNSFTRMIICKHKNHFMYLFERHFVVFFEHSIHGTIHLKDVVPWFRFKMSSWICTCLNCEASATSRWLSETLSYSYSFRWTNPTYAYNWKGCLKEMGILFCFLLFLHKNSQRCSTAFCFRIRKKYISFLLDISPHKAVGCTRSEILIYVQVVHK